MNIIIIVACVSTFPTFYTKAKLLSSQLISNVKSRVSTDGHSGASSSSSQISREKQEKSFPKSSVERKSNDERVGRGSGDGSSEDHNNVMESKGERSGSEARNEEREVV